MKTSSNTRRLCFVLCLCTAIALMCSGCGQRGDLYVPEKPVDQSEPE